MTRAGKSSCLINALTFGTSSLLICAHFFTCWSSWSLRAWKTSRCDLVGAESPASIAWLKVSNFSLNKLLLDVGHFVIEIIGRGERGFQARIIFEPFVE